MLVKEAQSYTYFMNKLSVTEEFKEILRPYVQNLSALDTFSDKTTFIEDLKINSANIVDVFLDTEEKFDIEISNENLENIKNVGDAINAIMQILEERDLSSS